MNPKMAIWISVALSAIAQIFLKHGLTNVQRKSTGGGVVALVGGVASEVFIWLWGICFVVAMGLWLSTAIGGSFLFA